VRNHWKIETNNYVRDVSLNEDKLRTKHTKSSQLLAGCRTLVVNFLTKEKLDNMRAKMESFVDDFNQLIDFFKEKKIL
jgi:predicted transposase YbfD/YdcC